MSLADRYSLQSSTASSALSSELEEGDVAMETLLSDAPYQQFTSRADKGKGREEPLASPDSIPEDGPPQEFFQDERETAAIEENLKNWTRMEKKKRAAARQSAQSTSPTLSDTVQGVSRKSSLLIKRATSRTSHQSKGSISSSHKSLINGHAGLFPIDSGIELQDAPRYRPKMSIDTDVSSITASDTVKSPSTGSDAPTPTERALKTGSRFVEDLGTQDQAGRPPNLTRPSVESARSFTKPKIPLSSSLTNIFTSITSPTTYTFNDNRSVKSSYSGPAATPIQFDLTPSNSYFDLQTSSSTRDLIQNAHDGEAILKRKPIMDRKPYRRESFEQEDEDQDAENDFHQDLSNTGRRRVSWFEWICCMCCLEEDNGAQGGSTMPDTIYRD